MFNTILGAYAMKSSCLLDQGLIDSANTAQRKCASVLAIFGPYAGGRLSVTFYYFTDGPD